MSKQHLPLLLCLACALALSITACSEKKGAATQPSTAPSIISSIDANCGTTSCVQ